MADTNLLPCPFCGGEASPDSKIRYSESHVKEQGWSQAEFYYCNCIRCGADNKGIIGHKTREKAIAAWNRRAPSPGAVELHGPYGYLIKPIGLNEEHWYLSDDQSDRPDEEISVPLYAKEGQVASLAQGGDGGAKSIVDENGNTGWLVP